jgi:hypothetical protein
LLIFFDLKVFKTCFPPIHPDTWQTDPVPVDGPDRAGARAILQIQFADNRQMPVGFQVVYSLQTDHIAP